MNLPYNKRVRPTETRKLGIWENRSITTYRLWFARLAVFGWLGLPAGFASVDEAGAIVPAISAAATVAAIVFALELGLLWLLTDPVPAELGALVDRARGETRSCPECGAEVGPAHKRRENAESAAESGPTERADSQHVAARSGQ